MLWQFFLIVLLIWVLILRWQTRGRRATSKRVKGNMPELPILGISHRFIGSDEVRMDTLKAVGYDAIKLGGLSKFWLGPRLFIVSADAEISDFVSKNCMEKDEVLRFTRTLIGNGSIFAPVSIWRPRRKILAPTFGLRNLNQFVDVFAEQSTIMANLMKVFANKDSFSIWEFITAYTMDSVCETTMGIKLDIQNQRNHPFLQNIDRLSKLISCRILQPWLWNNFIYKLTPYHNICKSSAEYMNTFVGKIIDNKRNALKEKEKEEENTNSDDADASKYVSKTFLEALINVSAGKSGYSEVELREETLVMVSAGTDTSAVGACFAALMLAKHQDVQEKVYQELQEIFGDSDEPVTSENLPRMKYLEVVVKESLRLYPPVPIIARVTEKEITIPNGTKVAPDVGFCLHIWAVHRNPKYWGNDAEEFRPERFIDSPPTHPAAFMPFSCGPRNCLGYQYAMMSMKTVLATLIRRYQILPSDQFDNSSDIPLRVKYDVMMKHVDNYKLKLKIRK